MGDSVRDLQGWGHHSASISPGVYAFGFLFMLPQLFVNYKVRCCP